MISLRNIHKIFNQHLVLNGVNLDIQSGEIFGIIGGSGAGKSTLLRCINLLERPEQGEIFIEDQNLLQLSNSALNQVRKKIGMIFQNYHLLQQQTVKANVALPLKLLGLSHSEIELRCQELLELVGLTYKADAYPEQLSGGQKQRVAIARALSTKPSILLCDEATAALDPQNTQAILKLLQDIQQKFNMTVVLITHDMQVAKKICHRLALMEEGEIKEISQWPTVLSESGSLIRNSIYGDLSSQLPSFVQEQLSETYQTHCILRLLFPGQGATIPFISTMCRQLNLDINILSAQIDHHHHHQCGIMIVSIGATPEHITSILKHCDQHQIIGEVLGYVERIHH
jgi:D-methionine transport system ATP-binding protein